MSRQTRKSNARSTVSGDTYAKVGQQTPRSGGRNILWALGAVCVAALVGWGALSLAQNDNLGKAAMSHAERMVAFGPRPSGSEVHKQTQQYIINTLKTAGVAVETDSFTAESSVGPIPMSNISGRIPGRSDRIFVIASHYDTKLSKNFRFVGANDGGSSTAVLLALAPLLARKSFNHEVRLVFFDGEESVPWEWDDSQALYGSRHLASRWQQDGTAKRVGAFILMDMIGDKDLSIVKEGNSTGWLQNQIWTAARSLGHAKHFAEDGYPMEDDHTPFLNAGIPAVDLIDFSYGPNNSYWHTAEDTLDKLSPRSMQVVGEVVLETLTVLDQK
jgi:glutaminyl-peptide cyclotransferase